METERDSYLESRKAEIQNGEVSVPFDFSDLEQAAIESLSDPAVEYAVASAGSGGTVRANESAFDQWYILPRVLRDVSQRSLCKDIWNTTISAPVILAPIGGHTRYHEDGESGSARAAASLGVPITVGTSSSHRIEKVANECPKASRFFQLYCLEDSDVNESLIRRAEQAGYEAIIITVDSQSGRWTPSTFGSPFVIDEVLENVATDPVAQEKGLTSQGDLALADAVTWSDIEELQSLTDLPVIVKGITHPEDAEKVVEHELDGVVVSNHGGRSVDGAVSSLEMLPTIVDVVDGQVPVLFDSGIRTGADIFKALALGADATLVGRPYLYGLALGGEQGVYEVTHNLLAEFESVLGMAGYTQVSSVERDALVSTEILAELRRTVGSCST